jgi:hypothetical protein
MVIVLITKTLGKEENSQLYPSEASQRVSDELSVMRHPASQPWLSA